MEYLRCTANRFTAEGSKTLFRTRPGNAAGRAIYIGGNSGAKGCDRSITVDKCRAVRA